MRLLSESESHTFYSPPDYGEKGKPQRQPLILPEGKASEFIRRIYSKNKPIKGMEGKYVVISDSFELDQIFKPYQEEQLKDGETVVHALPVVPVTGQQVLPRFWPEKLRHALVVTPKGIKKIPGALQVGLGNDGKYHVVLGQNKGNQIGGVITDPYRRDLVYGDNLHCCIDGESIELSTGLTFQELLIIKLFIEDGDLKTSYSTVRLPLTEKEDWRKLFVPRPSENVTSVGVVPVSATQRPKDDHR